MPRLIPGFSGLLVSTATLGLIWGAVWLQTPDGTFELDPQQEKGAFEKLLPIYLRIAEVVIGLASGSIVLLVGSSAFRAGGRLPWEFASPLFLLSVCVVYGVLFMVFEVLDYETYRHRPIARTYTRHKYVRNQALGFSSLTCFCAGYLWLIVIVTR
jgi:hypothetical protein